jgi:hypothetical protein
MVLQVEEEVEGVALVQGDFYQLLICQQKQWHQLQQRQWHQHQHP